MASSELARWKSALHRLGSRNRVHVSADMSACYGELSDIYSGTRILGVPSGERSGSWTAPPAWEVESARLVAPDGSVVADWHVQPLSLFTYSPPFHGTVDRGTLDQHLFSIPGRPDRTLPLHSAASRRISPTRKCGRQQHRYRSGSVPPVQPVPID